MTDGTGSLKYASHSRILGRVSFNRISQSTIDSLVSRSQWCRSFQQGCVSPTCFAVSLLSPLASSQIPAPGTTFAGTPLFEVCSAKVDPRCFVFHQHFSRVSTNSAGLSIPTGLLSFRLENPPVCRACFDQKSPCSVTITDSDGEFNIPTNILGQNRGSHFPPLAGLASMYRIFSPNSRTGVLFLRPCSLVCRRLPSLPMSHLFIRYAANSTSQHSIFESGGILTLIRCSNANFKCSGLTSLESHRALDDPVGLTLPLVSFWHRLAHQLVFPNRLEHPISCAANSRTSHHTELAPRSVESMCGHVLFAFVGSRLFWVTDVSHLRTRPVSSSSMSPSSVSPFNSMPFPSLFALNALSHTN